MCCTCSRHTARPIEENGPVGPAQAATLHPGLAAEGTPLLAPLQCHRPHLLHLPEGNGSRLLRPDGGGVPPVGGGLHGVLRTPDGREASPAESRAVRGRLSVLLRRQATGAGQAFRLGAPDKGDQTGEDGV